MPSPPRSAPPAFNQNCARCHGLEAESGGLAPDLRYLDKGDDGDAWFINRIRHGYTQNGMTKMPRLRRHPVQEAMWAIRTYLDSRYAGRRLNVRALATRRLAAALALRRRGGAAAGEGRDRPACCG